MGMIYHLTIYMYSDCGKDYFTNRVFVGATINIRMHIY